MESNQVEPKVALWKRPAVLRLLIIALLAEIGYAALNISTMPVYLKYDRNFGEGWIGLIVTAFLLSEAIFKGWMGKVADRVGYKRLMVIGPTLTVGTALLSLAIPHTGGRADEVLSFIVLRALDGLGAAMLWPAAFAAMSSTVDESENQQAMSMLNTCYLLGVALALPISGIVNDVTGTRWASLVFAAGLFIFVALSALRSVPEKPVVHSHHEGELDVKQLMGSAHTIPIYLLLAVVTFAGVGFPMAVIKLFAVDEFRMSESAFGLLVLPAAIAMAAFGVPMSKLGEKLGKHRAVHFGMGLCTLGVSLIALGAFIPPMRSVWVLALGGLPVGIGFLLAIPAWMASVSDLDPKARAANVGAVMTAQGVGAIIGAPLGSFCYGALQPVGISLGLGASFGHYSPFIGCALCVGAGWVLGLRILR
ncbi:MAG TPA: MFS transporter [Fimbriimonadaceae bacterium]|nr:MFS transporter [Fimbriimonadaceae bacterium]